jgi:5-hydroxyisourate hydrolase
MIFHTGDYFAKKNIDTFYPKVEVMFNLSNSSFHYHIPLLISPFGYTTYRGS